MDALQIGWATDRGHSREHNEDACLAWQLVLAQPQQPALDVGLLIVADGMGGLARGERASALAVRLASEYVLREVAFPLLLAEPGTVPQMAAPLHEILIESIRRAHQAVSRDLPGAGTTMTLALVLGDAVYIAHVGDSRAYLGGSGTLTRLTQDHSLAARLLELGQATAEEAAARRNLLYRAVGQGPEPEPDVSYHALQPGQYLLLCCDGLWGQVSEPEIVSIVQSARSAAGACRGLVARANEQGGDDNVTVVLASRGWGFCSGGEEAARRSEDAAARGVLETDDGA